MIAYLLEVGVLFAPEEETREEYEAYGGVYDRMYGYYDENQSYMLNKEDAIAEAKSYVKDGIDMTYGIVSETFLPDDILKYVDFDNINVAEEKYEMESVVFSVAKFGTEIKESFLKEEK